MALVNQDLVLDVVPGPIPPILHLTEYDENMQIVAQLFRRGQYYEIPSGTTAKVEGTLAGHPFSADATVDGSNVTFELTKGMTAYAGRAWTKIKLTKDSKPVSTCGFWLDCDCAGVEAGDVIRESGFTEQIAEAVEAWASQQGFTSPTVSITEITGGHRITFIDAQHPQGQSIDVMDGESRLVDTDTTLSHSGEAADAKATGDRINACEQSVTSVTDEYVDLVLHFHSGYYDTSGKTVSNSGFVYSDVLESTTLPTLEAGKTPHSVVTWKDGVFCGRTMWANIANVPQFDHVAYNFSTANYTENDTWLISAAPAKSEIAEEAITQANDYTDSQMNNLIPLVIHFRKGYWGSNGNFNAGTSTPQFYGSDIIESTALLELESGKTPHSVVTWLNGKCNGQTSWSNIANVKPFDQIAYNFSEDNYTESDTWIIESELSENIISRAYNYTDLKVSQSQSHWGGKTMNIIGDSITAGVGTTPNATRRYCEVAGELLGLTVNNYGVSGTCISGLKMDGSMAVRYANMANDADLIVVAGGTNDYALAVPLGTIADTTDVSFYGALDVLSLGLVKKYLGKRIVFLTPFNRQEVGANSAGHTFEEYRDAMKDVARKYGFAVIDGSSLGIHANVSEWRDLYMFDGLHPSVAGHELIGVAFAHALNDI